MGATEDLSMDDFKASMETNYLGAVRCIKAVLPSMREKRSGCIVNVTSISGRLAMSPFGAYAAPFIAWRLAMCDERWVEWGALDDDAWYSRDEEDFGLDARPKP